jgi:signal transduction histidine kinase
MDRITDQIEGLVWKLTAAISAIVLFSMGFIFLFLGRSATGLTPVLENYLRDGTLCKYSSRLEIVWRPLLATLQTTGMRLAELRAEAESARVAKAVAGMLRMVAHDVRKPITMTQTVVNMFAKLESGEEIKEIAKECIPELQQAISAVNGTLADVLEIESAAKPVIKNVALDEFIRTELRQALKHAPEKNPQVELEFQHQGNARLDPVKFARVLANIFGNALQLMPNHERIWARTSGLEGGGVLIVLGNGGTSIPQGDLPTIFDSFYSKRQGGTGLGLAIAQKIVKDHGGKIWAESDEGKVEFFIELPHS